MQSQIPRIVVVGGGAGGLNLVTRLSRKFGKGGRADITLVDENLTHIWKPSLHEFAAGTKGPEQEISFLEHSNRNGYTFRLGRFAGIDYQERWVMLDPVLSGEDVELSPARAVEYDILVLAIGSRSNDFGTPGVAEHCLFLDTPTEAKRLQSEILNLCLRMETGALKADRDSVRIAIVGGGATGVELAAELREATEQLGRHGIDKLRIPETVGISVIEGADRLVASLPEEISNSVLAELKSLNVDVALKTRVTSVSAESVHLSDGSSVEADIKVWAAGIQSNKALGAANGLDVGTLGRLMVGPTLQTMNQDRIFVIGDAADCYWPAQESSLPPRAQVAAQQAKFMVKQIERFLDDRPLEDFVYVDRGSLVALSSNAAIGSLMGRALGTLTLRGWLARRAYKFLHYQHEAAIQGHFRALLHTSLSLAMRRVRPHLKLH